MMRQYFLKRLYPENIERSLKGACKRAQNKLVFVNITTKTMTLPAQFECCRSEGKSGCYFEALSKGRVRNNSLKVILRGKNSNTLQYDGFILLHEIEKGMLVSYVEKERKARTKAGMVMGIKITPQEGSWIKYQLDLNHITQTEIARKIGCAQVNITQVLKGSKNSARIKKALAEALGYPDFSALIAASRGKTA